MNKAVATIGVIVVILIAAGAFWLFSVPPATAAVLYVDEGTVEIDVGKGWVPGQDEMELLAGAKVRTGAGAASVVMLEGEVMHLEPQTEVTLQEISDQTIKITQLLGETWHKVTKISGISTYEIETPSTVATVRGTEFYVTSDEEDAIAVEEGEVEVGFVKTPSKKLMVGPKRKMRMQAKLDTMTEEEFTDDPRAAKFKENYIKKLQRMRMREIKKNERLINVAMKRYGVTDEKMRQFLDDVDEGRQDEDKLYEQVPKPLRKKAERAYKITKAIKKARQNAQEKRDMIAPRDVEQRTTMPRDTEETRPVPEQTDAPERTMTTQAREQQ